MIDSPLPVRVPQTVRIAQEHGKHLAQLRHRATAMGFEGVHRKWTNINDAIIATTFLEPRKESPFAIETLIATVAA